MASQGGELSMDCKPHHSYSKLLKSFAEQNQSDQRYKLEEFVSRLEEERVKIDAFKRELPLCMQLLTNAMEASRQQLHAFRSSNQEYTRPILEEFIPITKHSNSQLESTDEKASDKASWMTSAQLWSEGITKLPQSTITTSSSPNKESTDNICFSVSPTKLTLDNKHGNGSGAFLPFSKERNSRRGALPELPLIASSEKEIMEEVKKRTEPETRGSYSNKKENNNSSKGSGDCGVVVDQGKGAAVASSETQTNTTTTSQNHRKARRSWSPDLHRRFVNALQMLGGSQVATPKQIRELMKVDSLTNDEVKSHLQKYRLHTRRPSPSMQTGAPAPQLVVLGGIWVPPEYATVAAAHTGATALYGTHAPPPHYCAATTAVPQEFYTAAVPLQSPLPPPPHHHLSESIEDGKSESSSWKGESGENEGERKGLAALRERGEESTGSEITLKF